MILLVILNCYKYDIYSLDIIDYVTEFINTHTHTHTDRQTDRQIYIYCICLFIPVWSFLIPYHLQLYLLLFDYVAPKAT